MMHTVRPRFMIISETSLGRIVNMAWAESRMESVANGMMPQRVVIKTSQFDD